MTPARPTAEQLRFQIEAAATREYPLDEIELSIAAGLIETGRHEGHLADEDLATVIRNIVYVRFTQQRIGGRKIRLIHNIPAIEVRIDDGELRVYFLVHIHNPIVAFLRFRYSLVNDTMSDHKKLRLKKGSLVIKKDTRRFDLKAKAALAAIDIESLALRELTDLAAIIKETLYTQMNQRGIDGQMKEVQLEIAEECLTLTLEGDFQVIGEPSPGS